MSDALDIFLNLLLPVQTAVVGATAIGLGAIEIAGAIEGATQANPVALIAYAAIAVCCLGYSVYMCRELAD